MGIKIDLPLVEAVYDMLRLTAPFKRWRLPEADAISFAISRDNNTRGEFHMTGVNKDVPVVTVNEKHHTTIQELMRTVAHEMCHLHEQLHGTRKDVHHGAFFNRAADQVCKAHNFDRGAF